jgi:hypothetical protein
MGWPHCQRCGVAMVTRDQLPTRPRLDARRAASGEARGGGSGACPLAVRSLRPDRDSLGAEPVAHLQQQPVNDSATPCQLPPRPSLHSGRRMIAGVAREPGSRPMAVGKTSDRPASPTWSFAIATEPTQHLHTPTPWLCLRFRNSLASSTVTAASRP